MKQYQFAFSDEVQLEKDIAKVRHLIRNCDESKVLFKVYSDILLTDSLDIVLMALEEAFPNAHIAGCTTNGNIMNGLRTDRNVFITCIVFEKPTTKIDVISYRFSGKSADEIRAFVSEVRSARPWIKAVELMVTMQALSLDVFHEVFSVINTDLIVFGGGSYNKDMVNDKSYVFKESMSYTDNSTVVIMYGGEELYIDTISIAGWKPLGQQYEITKAVDNIVYEINNRPAFDIYSKYLNVKNDIFFSTNSIEFPFLCYNDDGYAVLRTPVRALKDNSIQMFSKIDNFKYLRLTYGDPHTILNSVKQGAQHIRNFNPDMIYIYSCVARKSFWGKDIDKESSIYEEIAPTCGFFTSGELLGEDRKIHHYNETMVVVAMREGVNTQVNHYEMPEEQDDGEMPLVSRLVNFIGAATAELEEARMEAVRANKAKSDFLANMSHEIRTPINAVLGFDTMILRSTKDKNILDYAYDIENAGKNLLNIINDILDLSKIESGNMELVPAEYKTDELISDIVNMVTFKVEDKGLKLNVDIDDDIPSVLYGDDIRIKQVVVNLLNNAVKYTQQGFVTFSMKCTITDDTAMLRIAVKDSGIGIKEEDMANLFAKFKRIEEGRNRSIEGTGLGMSIVVQFLKLMESELEVSSVYGEGSEFGFCIKQKIVDFKPIRSLQEDEKEKKLDFVYKELFTASKARLLITDDNSLNRKVIRKLLGQTKVQIDEATGGYECIDMSMKQKYDIILLDHMMPDLDGIQTIHKIREDSENPNKDTVIIALTANALSGAKEEFLGEGFNSFLSKPVEPAVLESTIYEYLPIELLDK